jgi:hypothetical protein
VLKAERRRAAESAAMKTCFEWSIFMLFSSEEHQQGMNVV